MFLQDGKAVGEVWAEFLGDIARNELSPSATLAAAMEDDAPVHAVTITAQSPSPSESSVRFTELLAELREEFNAQNIPVFIGKPTVGEYRIALQGATCGSRWAAGAFEVFLDKIEGEANAYLAG